MDLIDGVTHAAQWLEQDCSYWAIKCITMIPAIKALEYGQRQECEFFGHCYVDQSGGGMTGDDFHGMVYFHIEGDHYLVAEYHC